MFDNVIALCLKSSDDACIFERCPLFEKCFPEEYKKWKKNYDLSQ
jgi:hypothetical protein